MIQNNNPGNIRYNPANNWVGQIGQDYRGFCIFDSLVHGIRAMMKIILNDLNEGDNTIEKLIYEYAPPSENNTELYISQVCSWSNISRDQILSWNNSSQICALISAMIRKETSEIVPGSIILQAYDLLSGGAIVTNPGGSNVETASFSFLPLILIGGALLATGKN